MNLRETDADFDPEEYVALVSQYHAEVVLLNVGGLVANYPSTIPGHFRNPFLRFDLVGETIARVHQAGIRCIGRFDFSKVHESLAAPHPEWLYRSLQGEIVNYNGYVHTCLNGEYQQRVLFDILKEALQAYPLDGVFFNMIGYQTSDYSAVYHGICQCDACRTRFKKESGRDLPVKEDPGDALFRLYDDFRRTTMKEQFKRVASLIKTCRPNAALATYTEPGVDIVISESNSDPDRPLPEWNYSASEQVKHVLGSYPGKCSCNLAMHFAGQGYRHVAVSPSLTEIRLAQDMIHGGWVGFVVIGRLDQQDDRRCLPSVKNVFDFHVKNHTVLGQTRSLARVCCVNPRHSAIFGSTAEYRGIFKMLSEAAIPFDVIDDNRLDAPDLPRNLDTYHTILLPETRILSDSCCRALDDFVFKGGRLLATGSPASLRTSTEARNAWGLQSLGMVAPKTIYPGARGRYLRVRAEDKDRLAQKVFEDLDLVYLAGDFLEFATPQGSNPHLRFINNSLFGPPERCLVAPDTDTPGLFYRGFGEGATVYFPWKPGEHYENRSHEGHAALFLGALCGMLGFTRTISIEPARPFLEISSRQDVNDHFEWIGLVNHSGQNGTAFLDGIPLQDTTMHVRPARKVSRVRLLRAGHPLDFLANNQGWLTCTIPQINRFEILVLEYAS